MKWSEQNADYRPTYCEISTWGHFDQGLTVNVFSGVLKLLLGRWGGGGNGGGVYNGSVKEFEESSWTGVV